MGIVVTPNTQLKSRVFSSFFVFSQPSDFKASLDQGLEQI